MRSRIGRIALVMLVIAFGACGDDDASGPSTTLPPDATPSFFDGLEDNWSADRVDDRSYGITISFTGDTAVGDVVAEVVYPGWDCLGNWTLTTVDGMRIEADESITINPDDICTTQGLVALVRDGSTIDYEWSYPDGTLSDTATLTPSE